MAETPPATPAPGCELLSAQLAAVHTWPRCVHVRIEDSAESPLQGPGCGLSPCIPIVGRVAGCCEAVWKGTSSRFPVSIQCRQQGLKQLDLSLLRPQLVTCPLGAAQHLDLQVQVTQPLPVESGPLLAAEPRS